MKPGPDDTSLVGRVQMDARQWRSQLNRRGDLRQKVAAN
jgi:hypothetical protein